MIVSGNGTVGVVALGKMPRFTLKFVSATLPKLEGAGLAASGVGEFRSNACSS